MLALFAFQLAQGKQTKDDPKQDDAETTGVLSLGIGLNSTNYAFKGLDFGLVINLKNYENEGSMTLFSLSYAHKISQHAYCGLALAVDQQHGEWLHNFTYSSLGNMQHENLGVFNRSCLTLAAEYRINYVEKKNYALYATLGAGATFYHEVRQFDKAYYLQGYENGINKYGPDPRQVRNSAFFNCNISPFGLQAGTARFKYFLELGVGYKGLIHSGINYSLK